MYKNVKNLYTMPRSEKPALPPLDSLDPRRFETAPILKQLTKASRRLAELKGVASAIPNQGILINTLGLQEAKDSSAIENIVTTHDELYRSAASDNMAVNPASKEVLRYSKALAAGFGHVHATGLLTVNHLCSIQASLEPNKAGLRKLPGTNLQNNAGETVYTPPQEHDTIVELLEQLERFINDDVLFDADPLIKMALIHHRFESIHPFYDGNGRTGRILNVLYLCRTGLLDIPVLYLSRHIMRTKPEYYRCLQAVRDNDAWGDWVVYMLEAVERTAAESVATIEAIRALLLDTKQRIRAQYAFYSQDLINNLFSHPYTKIGFIQHDLGVSRVTATKYLDELVSGGFLHKEKMGRSNYYINLPLFQVLAGERMQDETQ